MSLENQHLASAVLMVEPTTFGFDEQTAATNTFQHRLNDDAQTTKAAIAEFNVFVKTLRAHDVEVFVFRDRPTPPKPDAVFPNNWLSAWPDGRIFLYPMATPVRRLERSKMALKMLETSFSVKEIVDLSSAEKSDSFLESTGAIVFDHLRKIAYACISPRCDERLFRTHAALLGYEAVAFHAVGTDGTPIYHTNVMLGVQSNTAVVCGASIVEEDRARVLESLKASGRDIIDISFEQMDHFCGNLLEIQNRDGEACIALSQTAYDAFTDAQRAELSREAQLIPVKIPTIETVGGGSARCMMAEIFLPRRMAVRQPNNTPRNAATII